MALAPVAAHHERAEPQPLQRAEQREAQELLRRRDREQPLAIPEADADRAEAELVAEAELLGEAEHAVVGRQHHVVEAIDVVAVEVEARHQAAEAVGALHDVDLHARLREAVCGGEAHEAAADDADARHGCDDPLAARWRAARRQ